VQLAASHLVRAEATVSCRGRGGSAVAQGDEFIGSFAENGGHHRATQSHVACVRWWDAVRDRWVRGGLLVRGLAGVRW
jgi:hypothetical protein